MSRPMLSNSFVEAHKRHRIIVAVAEQVAEEGIASATVGTIVKRAGVARKTFYDLYGCKDDSFTAAVEYGFDLAAGRIGEAAQGDSLEDRVDAAIAALIQFVADEPSLARICLVDAYANAAAQREAGMERFARMSGLPEPTAHMTIGGVAWMLYRHIVEGQPTDALGPDLSKFVMAAFEKTTV